MKDSDNTPPHPVQDLIIYPIQRNPQNSRQQKEKKQRSRISPEGEIEPFHSGEKLLKHIRAIQRRKRNQIECAEANVHDSQIIKPRSQTAVVLKTNPVYQKSQEASIYSFS